MSAATLYVAKRNGIVMNLLALSRPKVIQARIRCARSQLVIYAVMAYKYTC